jgi:hypothetical protein
MTTLSFPDAYILNCEIIFAHGLTNLSFGVFGWNRLKNIIKPNAKIYGLQVLNN